MDRSHLDSEFINDKHTNIWLPLFRNILSQAISSGLEQNEIFRALISSLVGSACVFSLSLCVGLAHSFQSVTPTPTFLLNYLM